MTDVHFDRYTCSARVGTPENGRSASATTTVVRETNNHGKYHNDVRYTRMTLIGDILSVFGQFFSIFMFIFFVHHFFENRLHVPIFGRIFTIFVYRFQHGVVFSFNPNETAIASTKVLRYLHSYPALSGRGWHGILRTRFFVLPKSQKLRLINYTKMSKKFQIYGINFFFLLFSVTNQNTYLKFCKLGYDTQFLNIPTCNFRLIVEL